MACQIGNGDSIKGPFPQKLLKRAIDFLHRALTSRLSRGPYFADHLLPFAVFAVQILRFYKLVHRSRNVYGPLANREAAASSPGGGRSSVV